MSKFNKNAKIKPNSVNMAGGESFDRNDSKKDIVQLVMNSMLNGDSFYESEKARIDRIIKMIESNVDLAEFVAKAMVYTRNTGNLRSISHLMGAILAENVKGVDFLRPAIYKTLVRPDDATEIVSLWLNRNKNEKVPNAVQRAIKDALESKWDEYQLKKYLGNSNEVKLKDLVKMFRPNPEELVKVGKAKDINVYKRVIEDTLDNIMTAQTVNANVTGEDRKDAYKEMLKAGTLGYMAAIKNIKNILEAGAGEKTINRLCDLLTNEKAVLKSRLLPFRFVQAYKEVEKLNIDKLVLKKVLKAIEKGFEISSKNIPIVEDGEKVALLLDESGSMEWGGNGDTSPFTIGKTLMASMLCGLNKENTIGWCWSDRAREINIDLSPMEFIKQTQTIGGGTDLKSAFNGLINTKTFVDKIVIITDGQGWRSTYNELAAHVAKYKTISPKVKILFWNVEGYTGGTPLKLNNGVMEVVGFSDKILDVIAKMWVEPDALIKEIEAIKLV